MMGIQASGKKIEWTDIIVTCFDDGKIAEEWILSELMDQLLLKSPST
jgi:predicted ester cyclase